MIVWYDLEQLMILGAVIEREHCQKNFLLLVCVCGERKRVCERWFQCRWTSRLFFDHPSCSRSKIAIRQKNRKNYKKTRVFSQLEHSRSSHFANAALDAGFPPSWSRRQPNAPQTSRYCGGTPPRQLEFEGNSNDIIGERFESCFFLRGCTCMKTNYVIMNNGTKNECANIR